ncbi:glutamate--tRNA ligase [Desulfuribacillus alkaliarsenatis]|uniref:Glutamate--tRNA ligase n=1 Tax=Desulfuribacillus alkaliarsenatis TaxID=766136 RepID=A0A1E5G4E9_9FIRM|nr:glutamate--tRNA ligase [Desulfuribacillus alkaliarsenatis]OEF97961.1 glutamate--tRNA ligase [Desulfuribacillus alkaliarsenatis]
MKETRVRFAPSPTGHLHIGGARSALFNYLYAKKNNGKFILRFEDTDQNRNVASAEAKMLESMRWLGIDWDEGPEVGGPHGPYRSSERLDLYRPYVDKLLETGHAYRCYCAPEELEAEREALMAKGETPRYLGKCRSLNDAEEKALAEQGRKPVVRFRVPQNENIVIRDQVRGRVSFESDGIGDFVIIKSDGMPTYNMAVTIDDHLMEITDVIRGEEHLSNTPRQVLIYKALGFEIPTFAHVSLILGKDRQKMSKRDESVIQFVEQYRDLGFVPGAIVNFLALLGWSPEGEQEIFSMDELIQEFSLDRVAKNPAVFDAEKLNWMNNHYLKQADIEYVTNLAIPHLQKAGYIGEAIDDDTTEWLHGLIELYVERTDYAAQFPELVARFFEQAIAYDDEAKEVLAGEQVQVVLDSFIQQVEQIEQYEPGAIQAAFKTVQKETGVKGKQLFMPVRVAATGVLHGPDLNKSLWLLGKERVIGRLQTCKKHTAML